MKRHSWSSLAVVSMEKHPCVSVCVCVFDSDGHHFSVLLSIVLTCDKRLFGAFSLRDHSSCSWPIGVLQQTGWARHAPNWYRLLLLLLSLAFVSGNNSYLILLFMALISFNRVQLVYVCVHISEKIELAFRGIIVITFANLNRLRLYVFTEA